MFQNIYFLKVISILGVLSRGYFFIYLLEMASLTSDRGVHSDYSYCDS